MSGAKENTCRKFQANIFNKSKCQNCFKPRELHLLTDQDLNQRWCHLGPGLDNNEFPMKWQRRFFVLYEHGCLRFALDESPSTLPQGTVNMNLCTDVIDAEARTGQKNALCINTPEQEYYIRGDNKEIINGWTEQLVVYPRTNKQNQKKKRKVEPATSQVLYTATCCNISHQLCFYCAMKSVLFVPNSILFKPEFKQNSWKKYWFVLTDHSLRYYKDSIAEEASDLDGEIDLSTCYNVTEYQAQRNYGFQIHTQEAVHTLSAMTAGIRRNWIQAVMKNVRPSTAPDVASLTDEHASCGPFESLARPDVTQDSLSSETSVEREGGLKKSRARERRREGRSKTFDWAEFRPIAQALAQQRAHEADTFQAELTERNKRREERRRRYESVTGSSFDPAADITKMDFESGGVVQVDAPPPSEERQQRVEDEIEQRWQQVEKTPIREERRVPLPSTQHNRDASELENLLESYRKGVRASKSSHKLELEGQLKNALQREQQIRAGYISPATCERGFAAMEESHQKVIDELQKKHQRELEKLQEEKERLLAEETAATISAIEAMKNAHRSELERELEKTRKANSNTENADIEEIHKQHEEELMSYQREIEVLSEQYSQKCLENAHLAQALEAERQALRQCQRENQELNAHNQELNNRLAAEITKMRSMASEDGGDAGGGMQGKELYELEVMRRVKESEVQYLKQEINSLKDELQTAHRDKKYATDKYKDIYTELSIVRAKAERDLSRLREQLQQAHDALGQPALEDVERGGYDIMKSKSNPDILKMAAAAAKRSERTMRSKSLKEGLTAEQRLHLLDNKDTKDF
uniref:Myosin phosphatase Rho-interacting protein-like n=1 Tax=Sinocyclocheilus rhinocerous TaxID=307959 RepID=A0A673ILP2_9TELE